MIQLTAHKFLRNKWGVPSRFKLSTMSCLVSFTYQKKKKSSMMYKVILKIAMNMFLFWGLTLAMKAGDTNSIPESYIMEGEEFYRLFSDTRTHTHTSINVIIRKNILSIILCRG